MKCNKCDIEIDKETDVNTGYVLPSGEIYCEECFRDWLEDMIEDKSGLNEVASALEIQIV